MKVTNRTSLRILLATLALMATWPASAADLLSLYQRAQHEDPAYNAARADYRAAREAKPQARAAVLPQLQFTASHTEENQKDLSTHRSDDFSADQYGISLSQTLFNWNQFSGLDRADAQVAQAESNLASSEQDLIIRVSQAYFNVLSAADGLRFAQAEKKAISRQLEQAKQRFDVGLIPVTDVKAAQASYDLARAREIEAQNQLANAREALRSIIGAPAGNLASLGDDLPLREPDPADPEQWVQTATSRNPDLLSARSAAEVARYDIKQARAGHYPEVDLVASHDHTDEGGGFRQGEFATNSIGVQLTWNFYAGGATFSRTSEAQARFDAARSRVTQSQRSVEQSTRDAYRGLEASISRVDALAQAVESNRASVEATQAGFKVGTRTAVDVLNALRDLYGAQRDYADARYNYIVNRLKLKQAAGTLTVDDVRLVNSWLTEPDS